MVDEEGGDQDRGPPGERDGDQRRLERGSGSADRFRKAAEVRREDFQSCILLAQSLRMLGRPDEAREANREGVARAERTLARSPLDERALSPGSSGLLEDGQVERALEWSRRSLEAYPDSMGVLIDAAGLRAKLRQKEEALELLDAATPASRDSSPSSS